MAERRWRSVTPFRSCAQPEALWGSFTNISDSIEDGAFCDFRRNDGLLRPVVGVTSDGQSFFSSTERGPEGRLLKREKGTYSAIYLGVFLPGLRPRVLRWSRCCFLLRMGFQYAFLLAFGARGSVLQIVKRSFALIRRSETYGRLLVWYFPDALLIVVHVFMSSFSSTARFLQPRWFLIHHLEGLRQLNRVRHESSEVFCIS